MSKTKKTLIALLLMVYGVFGSELASVVPNIFPTPEPPAAKILNIDEPSEDVINRVELFSDLITDPDDRAKMAIFNYEFAERIIDYKTNAQQVNDVYSLSGKKFFKKSMLDKYDNLAEEIIKLMAECIGKENNTVAQEQKQELHDYFMGIAWVLIHKG
jgi:AAA+ ATPase superfamily predicted ATPase